MRLAHFVFIVFLGLFSSCVFSLDYKIGFVNTERVLRDSEPARLAETKLESEFSERVKQLKQMEDKLRDLQSRFERDASSLADGQRRDRERELNDAIREFQRRQREANEELNARRNEEYQGIIEMANTVIRDIAEHEKFDLIFQEAVYTSARVDITDKVLKALMVRKGVNAR